MSDNTDDMNDLVLLAMARDEAVSKVKELEAKLTKAVALANTVGTTAADFSALAELKGQDDE